MDQLDEISLDTLPVKAPLIQAQMECDAEEDHEEPSQHVAGLEHGLTSYVAELAKSCREQLNEAEQRPRILALSEQLRAKRLVLPTQQLETLARYQATLDVSLLQRQINLHLSQTNQLIRRSDSDYFLHGMVSARRF